MKNDTKSKVIAASICAAALIYLYYPENDEVSNSGALSGSIIDREQFNHPASGIWVRNPGYCAGLLSIRGLQTYEVSQHSLRVGNQVIPTTWAIHDNSSKSALALELVQNCKTLKEYVPSLSSSLVTSTSYGAYEIVRLTGTPYAVIFIDDQPPFISKRYTADAFEHFELDYEYHSDFANDLNEHEWEWDDHEPSRNYGLRDFVEYYDDDEFYKQFEEAEEIINELDRLEVFFGE